MYTTCIIDYAYWMTLGLDSMDVLDIWNYHFDMPPPPPPPLPTLLKDTVSNIELLSVFQSLKIENIFSFFAPDLRFFNTGLKIRIA